MKKKISPELTYLGGPKISLILDKNFSKHKKMKIIVNVRMIFSNKGAFAALLDDGRVFAWGSQTYGGAIPHEIQIQLKNVKMLFSTLHAFAALLEDGSVLAWGYSEHGGKIPEEVQPKLLKNVKMILPEENRFAALCNNGDVIRWGWRQN